MCDDIITRYIDYSYLGALADKSHRIWMKQQLLNYDSYIYFLIINY